MQKSNSTHQAMSAHRRVKTSTTLNRKYVKRPVRIADAETTKPKIISTPRPKVIGGFVRNAQIDHFAEFSIKNVRQVKRSVTPNNVQRTKISVNKISPKQSEQIASPTKHPLQVNAQLKARQRLATNIPAPKPTAKELKDQAIAKALLSASRQLPDQGKMAKTIAKAGKKSTKTKMRFGVGRVMLAFSCAAAAVAALVYFVNLNMPDISLKVAAMQTGIEAKYPSYTPRGYNLSSITSENGKITLNFKESGKENSYVLIEENSSWDSNALYANYVSSELREDYTVVREQGLTIYIDNEKATWVNGGIVYKLLTSGEMLTKKQISAIATSL